MKKAVLKEWFWSKKKMELYESYRCQRLANHGEIVGETEKAYKISVWALFMCNEKYITIWAPKSVCTLIGETI